MTVEYIKAPQGSPEWHEARAGVITASMFGEVLKVVDGLTDQQQKYVDAILAGKPEPEARELACYKAKPSTEKITRALDGETVGDWSSAAKDYAFILAAERISGQPMDEGFETWAMRRGHELEPEARLLHSFMTGQDIEEVGFVRTMDGKFGASADGLFGDDDGAEYKCFIDGGKLRSIIIDREIDPYRPQCHGGLWLTGRKRWHFGLYCPALKPAGKALTLFVIDRDDSLIERMESRLLEFDSLVESYRAALLKDQLRAAA